MSTGLFRLFRGSLFLVVLGSGMAAGVWCRDAWLPAAPHTATTTDPGSHHDEPSRSVVELSSQARKNLNLVAGPVALSTYWRSILVPGEIMDRPGLSDRGITSPAVGIVTQIHAFPGDTVRPGTKLFTLRLLSEYIHNTQSELFKVTREIELETEKRQRLTQIGEGAIPQVRIIEVDQQLRRLQAALTSHRQDLLTRGLSPEQIAEVEAGRFVTTVEIVAPPPAALASSPAEGAVARDAATVSYEVQDLRVDLGTQVQAGQLLAILSDHEKLFVVGHAFNREASSIERAAQEHWPVRVEIAEDDAAAWPPLDQRLEIRHLANAIDPASRTFEFFVPLVNQSRSYEKDGRTFVVWRYRPGQRVRLHVPVEKLDNVIVLPAGAVVRDGPDAWVFRQKVGRFERVPVHVLYEDRLDVVVANDGSVKPGWLIAQGSAASLNRVLEAQASSGAPPGMHVHADGSVHGSH